jgi:peptide deformylase
MTMTDETFGRDELRTALDAGSGAVITGPDEPALRRRARMPSADLIGSPEMDALIARMWATLDAIPHGIGLAAPQVGLDLAIFLASHNGARLTILAPRRLSRDLLESIETWEGCLSMPGFEGRTRRPRRLSVAYSGLGGAALRHDAAGTLARIFDHELDHLDGRLFVDRVLPETLQPTHSAYIAVATRRR